MNPESESKKMIPGPLPISEFNRLVPIFRILPEVIRNIWSFLTLTDRIRTSIISKAFYELLKAEAGNPPGRNKFISAVISGNIIGAHVFLNELLRHGIIERKYHIDMAFEYLISSDNFRDRNMLLFIMLNSGSELYRDLAIGKINIRAYKREISRITPIQRFLLLYITLMLKFDGLFRSVVVDTACAIEEGINPGLWHQKNYIKLTKLGWDTWTETYIKKVIEGFLKIRFKTLKEIYGSGKSKN